MTKSSHSGRSEGATSNRGSSGQQARRRLILLGIVALPFCLGYVGWLVFQPDAKLATEDTRPPEPGALAPQALAAAQTVVPPSRSAGYLGPQACAECHAERVTEFANTQHFRACREPKLAEMPSGFSQGNGNFRAPSEGIRFEMSRIGSEFFQTSIRQTPSGEQRHTSRIDLVYGAGTADDVYLSWDGESLYELPVAWLHTSNRWGASFFDPYGSGNFGRALTPRCLECHNTFFQHRAGSANHYRRDDVILGVTCENCHGPGAEHAEWHRTHRRDTDREANLDTQANTDSEGNTVAQAILQPRQLSRERQIELCTQCHSNAIKLRGPAFSYRPHKPLSEHFLTLDIKHTEDDHVANQIQYLRQSKCFQLSTMTCTTCHDPHRSQKDHGGSATCAQCHTANACRDAVHQPTSIRDDCVACHMPSYYKINVCFQTEHDSFYPPIRRFDHRIAVHPHARKEVFLRWHQSQTGSENEREAMRLSGELVQYWLAEAEKCRAEYRFTGAIAAVREAVRIDNRPELQTLLKETVAIQTRLNDDSALAAKLINENQTTPALEILERILSVNPHDATAHGKLGMLLANRGDKVRASDHLAQVAQHDPNDAYGVALLGWMSFLDNQYSTALDLFRQADSIEPYNGKIQFQLGITHAMLKQPKASVEHCLKSLEIEPQRLDACQCLVAGLRELGRSAEAVPYAQHAMTLTGGNNLKVTLTLAETCAEAGLYPQAVDVMSLAINLASTAQPTLVPELQRILLELQKLTAVGASGRSKN